MEMRIAICVLLGSLAGCSPPEVSDPAPATTPTKAKSKQAGSSPSGASTSTTSTTTSTTIKPTSDTGYNAAGLPEFVVYVRMSEYDNPDDWFCTGTLLAKDKVVTAGHCLDTATMFGWSVIAPSVAGAPRVTASNPRRMGSNETAEEADVGLLTLDTPIEISTYGQLTDVSADVEAGKTITAKTTVRTQELPEAPLHTVDVTGIESAVDAYYTHGYRSTRFSHGGDSGAGVFLAENGKITNKVFAFVREPDGNIDYQTRVDPDVLAWLNSN
jgi:V8-like Glu-specific endopeptidase